MKLLDFLAEHPEFDYNVMELSRHAAVARPTVYKVLARLTKQGIVEETRRIGNSTFFRLNLAHPSVARMLAMREEMGAPAPGRPRRAKPATRGRAQGRT
ncbi:MAG TPA: helix-turn-helix domain-containing protein [Candidatus Thermoplasmatota archaeon]|nr:helix-turn-helix domain-containing protein [Candidatus Thermoplasmatota archaeon]